MGEHMTAPRRFICVGETVLMQPEGGIKSLLEWGTGLGMSSKTFRTLTIGYMYQQRVYLSSGVKSDPAIFITDKLVEHILTLHQELYRDGSGAYKMPVIYNGLYKHAGRDYVPIFQWTHYGWRPADTGGDRSDS